MSDWKEDQTKLKTPNAKKKSNKKSEEDWKEWWDGMKKKERPHPSLVATGKKKLFSEDHSIQTRLWVSVHAFIAVIQTDFERIGSAVPIHIYQEFFLHSMRLYLRVCEEWKQGITFDEYYMHGAHLIREQTSRDVPAIGWLKVHRCCHKWRTEVLSWLAI